MQISSKFLAAFGTRKSIKIMTFWSKCHRNGTKMVPKSAQGTFWSARKRYVVVFSDVFCFFCNFVAARGGPRSTQEGPRGTQRTPRGAQEGQYWVRWGAFEAQISQNVRKMLKHEVQEEENRKKLAFGKSGVLIGRVVKNEGASPWEMTKCHQNGTKIVVK